MPSEPRMGWKAPAAHAALNVGRNRRQAHASRAASLFSMHTNEGRRFGAHRFYGARQRGARGKGRRCIVFTRWRKKGEGLRGPSGDRDAIARSRLEGRGRIMSTSFPSVGALNPDVYSRNTCTYRHTILILKDGDSPLERGGRGGRDCAICTSGSSPAHRPLGARSAISVRIS